MKKIILLLLLAVFAFINNNAYSQCSPTSAGKTHRTPFNEPGQTPRYNGFMCGSHNTLLADTSGGNGGWQFADGDGYGVRLYAGSQITITLTCPNDTIALTINDTIGGTNNPISGAYAAPLINNTINFTATYTGLYLIVFSRNGVCGSMSNTAIGDVSVVLNNSGSITCPPVPVNDTICGAIALTVNVLVNGDNTTAAPTDPRDADVLAAGFNNCGAPNNTLWYTFTPSTTGNYLINTTSPANGLNCWVGVYTAASCTGAINPGNCYQGAAPGGSASQGVTLTGSTTYYIMMDGRQNSIGAFTLEITTPPPVPVNDTICGAITLVLNTPVAGDNTTAWTTDPRDADMQAAGYTCSPPSNTMWYTFTPATTANYNVNTTSPATGGLVCRVGVFAAPNCNAPFAAGAICAFGANAGGSAANTAAMTSGTKYYISIEGSNGTPTGQYTVAVTLAPPVPPNDTICGATLLVLNTPINDDNTLAAATDPRDTATYACGPKGNTLWYKFTPATSGNYYIQTSYTGGTGLDAWVGVYTALSCTGNIAYVTCKRGCTTGGALVNDTIAMTAGTHYYIMTDGYQGSTGPYTIEIVQGAGSGIGINHLATANEISVSPNPATNQVSVKFYNGITPNTQIQLMDVTGRILSTTNATTSVTSVDLSGVSAGLYFIKISNNKTTLSITKLIKE